MKNEDIHIILYLTSNIIADLNVDIYDIDDDLRTLLRRCGGAQDAALLPVRGHRQHRLQDGDIWGT